MDELFNLLRLIGVKGIGNKRILKLVDSFGCLDSVFKAPIQEIINVTGIEYGTVSEIPKDIYRRFADRQISEAKKNNFTILRRQRWKSSY